MKIKTPYAFNLLMPIIIWSILCSTFLFLFSNFDIKLIVLSSIYILTFYLIYFILFKNNIKLFNNNISPDGKYLNIETEEVKNTLNYLTNLSRKIPIRFLSIEIILLLLIIITNWVIFASVEQLFLILISGGLMIFLSFVFLLFICQKIISYPIKDCRRILLERNEEEDNNNFLGLKLKCVLLLILPFSFFILYFNNQPIIFLELLLMIIIIYRIAYKYFKNTLKEFKEFSKEVSKNRIAVFSSGSLDKEIVNLSKALNKTSERVFLAESDLDKSKKEIIKKEKELDKLFELTISRELKMIELKKTCIKKQF